VSDPDLQARPQFPSLNKYIRLARKAHRHFITLNFSRFPTLPYWKLLTPTGPAAPVPINLSRAPTVPVTEASDFMEGGVPLLDDLNLVDYPQPPSELSEPVTERTIVDKFGEAEWDKRRYNPFLLPAMIKVEHSAILTKFGRVQKTTGSLHVSRFVLEELGLEPRSGDLFQWEGQLKNVMEADERYGYLGSSGYWTWIKMPFDDFHGDSSNLMLPVLPDTGKSVLRDDQ
jgi:hypothetical protein